MRRKKDLLIPEVKAVRFFCKRSIRFVNTEIKKNVTDSINY